jgi:hypothetical protein
VRDLETNGLTLASRASGADGSPGDAGGGTSEGSSTPSISADGRYIAFISGSNNLSPDDGDSDIDVYVRDLQANTTTLVSRAAGVSGAPGNGESRVPSISADGRYVAFNSFATNLSPDDANGKQDVYVRDLQATTITLVSRAGGAAGTPGNGNSLNPAVSADGRYVAFQSAATNLDPDDTDSLYDIYVHDLQANTTTLASRAGGAAGVKSNGDSYLSVISGNGGLVAFYTRATNLRPEDTDDRDDVYVRDLQAGNTTLASRADGPAGQKGNDDSLYPAISADGRYLAFFSQSSNLTADCCAVPVYNNARVFVRDLQQNDTSMESRGTVEYPRPKAATPLYAPLVVAFEPCGLSNRSHAPPLSSASCNPPAASSGSLTVGTFDSNGQQSQLGGFVRLKGLSSDVPIDVNITDVRNKGDLADYAGELRLSARVRATDRSSPRPTNGELPGPATVRDITFGPSVPCAATPDPTVGATCSIATSVNSLIPGAVVANVRTIWEFNQIQVFDGGPDGDGDTVADNTPFLRQGIFAP